MLISVSILFMVIMFDTSEVQLGAIIAAPQLQVLSCSGEETDREGTKNTLLGDS